MAERKTDKLTEAAEKTTAVLQGLQSRLSREAGGVRAARPEIPDELGQQLEQYFAAASLPGGVEHTSSTHLDEIQGRVLDTVAARILRGWQEPGGQLSAIFKDALVERLVERVLDSLQSQDTKPGRSR